MATGSHAQFIKILTLNGDQLGNIIKYHDVQLFVLYALS
jgi:hypothetical protein